MTKNSARIYIMGNQSVYDREALEQALGIKVYTGDQAEYDAVRKEVLAFHYSISNREPREKLMQAQIERIMEQRKERIKVKRTDRYTRILHSQLGLENVSRMAKKLSTVIDAPIVSLADFDQSVFQMCLYLNGELRTAHQIGEELADMGLSEQRADPSEIVKAFNTEEQVIKKVIDNEDVWDVEDGIIALIEE